MRYAALCELSESACFGCRRRSRRARYVLSYGLGKAGFDVQTAPDARTALDSAQTQRPDAIILDVMLPEIDGFSALPALRRITEVPIIMLSAKTTIEDKVLGLSRGADDYVIKPFKRSPMLIRQGPMQAPLRVTHC